MIYILCISQNYHHLFTIPHYQTILTLFRNKYGHIMHHFCRYSFQINKKVIIYNIYNSICIIIQLLVIPILRIANQLFKLE